MHATNNGTNTLTTTKRTWTGLCVARLGRIAYTILATVHRRRVRANSGLNPAATNLRARTKTRPSAVKYTILCNAI